MLRRNGRLIANLMVLALVLATLWYVRSIGQQPASVNDLPDMPPLGQVPSERQIHGSDPPPVPHKR
jgi:hypothetical protein